MSTSNVEAKIAITELLYRYAELIDAGDFDGVGELLAHGSFMGVSGAEKIAKLFEITTRRRAECPTMKPALIPRRPSTASR